MPKQCEVPDCTTRANYNFPGERGGRRCAKHKLKKMENIYKKECEDKDCTTDASYNFLGANGFRFCKRHKLKDMKNLRSKKCKLCSKIPSYGASGVREYCGEHKDDETMVLIGKRTCEHDGCSVIPCFNEKGFDKGRFCATHQLKDMVNVVSRQCEDPGCSSANPCFNFEGLKPGIRCGRHRLPKMVDVMHPRCAHEGGCRTHPKYGLPGHPPTHCAKHKQTGMIPNPKRRCIECPKGKKSVALYGLASSASSGALFCEKHHDPKMHTNLIERPCLSCGLENILDHEGLCWMCNPSVFNCARLAKQNQVEASLKQQFPQVWAHVVSVDKQIEDAAACELRTRPDALLEVPTHFAVGEVDENQHRGRPELCECTRMINMAQALGKPTLFVRYNPDSFRALGSRRKTLGPSHNARMATLGRVLKEALEMKPEDIPGFCCVVHLFFDGYSEATSLAYEVITPFESEPAAAS